MLPSVLEKIYQYPQFGREELEKIGAAHQKVVFRKGDYFLKAGQVSEEYYCLETGLVRSYVLDYEGKEITTAFFGANEIVIDVVSLFQRSPTQENIHALTDCTAWKIDFLTFQTLFLNVSGFSEWGREWLTRSFFELKKRSIAMIAQNAKDRYLALLENHAQIVQYAPQKYIATYLGITDTSLSRIRKEITQ